MINAKLEGISFDIVPAEVVPDHTYKSMNSIEQEAFALNPALKEGEVEHLTKAKHLDQYMAIMRDPNLQIEQGLVQPDQEFARPYVVLALRGKHRIAGFAYSADNVSGKTEEIRKDKKEKLVHNYRWLPRIVVHPDFQRRGIAAKLAQFSLGKARLKQPAYADVWPKLMPHVPSMLNAIGFEPINAHEPEEIYPFGEPGNSRKVMQVRYVSKNARESEEAAKNILVQSQPRAA